MSGSLCSTKKWDKPFIDKGCKLNNTICGPFDDITLKLHTITQNCGKKGNPEYQGMKIEFNNIISLKT